MERLDHGVDFVQVGIAAIRLDQIAWIEFYPEAGERNADIVIHLAGDERHKIFLWGLRAMQFSDWWNAHANVWVIDQKEEPDDAGN
jgi:hypothetical protein